MPALLARDFDGLAVGGRFVTPDRRVTEADITSFAGLTGDTHPQHTDAEWAAGSPFGERIAHGMLVASCALGLLEFDHERVIALRRLRQVTFKRPVAIGDAIHCEGRIDSLVPVDERTGVAGIRLDVVNHEGRVAVRMSLDVLWRRAEP